VGKKEPTIAKLWKQSSCPTTDEFIFKNVVFIHNGIYSVTKNNEILSFTGKWMELENIILRLRRPKAACSPSCAGYRPQQM
jgi:hypothetical protein